MRTPGPIDHTVGHIRTLRTRTHGEVKTFSFIITGEPRHAIVNVVLTGANWLRNCCNDNLTALAAGTRPEIILFGLVLPRSGVVQSELSTRQQHRKSSSHRCRPVQLDHRSRTREELFKPMKILVFQDTLTSLAHKEMCRH